MNMNSNLGTSLKAAAVAGVCLSGTAAIAFPASIPGSDQRTEIGTCRAGSITGGTRAEIFLETRPGVFLTGGARWINGTRGTDLTITTSILETRCGLTNIENFSARGADAESFIAQDEMFLRFVADDNETGERRSIDITINEMGVLTLENVSAAPEQTAVEPEAIAGFMQDRNNSLIAAQPDLIGQLSGAATGTLNIDASQDNGSFDMATAGGQPVWATLQGNWSESGEAENSYIFGAVGAHYTISPQALVGVMVEFDTFDQDNGDTSTTGDGYLIGPYVVAKLPNQPLYFEGRYLIGQTDDAVTIGDEEAQDFDTDRVLASVKMAGNLAYGDLTLTPSLTATHLEDTQKAFTANGGDDVAEQAVTTQDVAIGLDFAQPLPSENGTLALTGGFSGIWSRTEGTGFAEALSANFEGELARVHLGTRYSMDNGMILSAATSYDGIGSDDYKSFGVALGLEMKF